MDKEFLQYFIDRTDERFDKVEGKFDVVESKLDRLFAFKWQIVGGSVFFSSIVAIFVSLYKG